MGVNSAGFHQKPESKFLRLPTAMANTAVEGEADARADPAGRGSLRPPARTVALLEARHVRVVLFLNETGLWERTRYLCGDQRHDDPTGEPTATAFDEEGAA